MPGAALELLDEAGSLSTAVSSCQKEEVRQALLTDGSLRAVAQQFSQAVKVLPALLLSTLIRGAAPARLQANRAREFLATSHLDAARLLRNCCAGGEAFKAVLLEEGVPKAASVLAARAAGAEHARAGECGAACGCSALSS